jgi:hypothetical protein
MKKTEFNPLGFLGFLGFLSFFGLFYPSFYFLNLLFFLLFLGFIPCGDKIKEKGSNKEDDNPGSLFIPAGVLTGMGIGFFTGNLPGGMFTGLGIGFILFAVTEIIKKNKRLLK